MALCHIFYLCDDLFGVAEQICDMIDAIGGDGYSLRNYVERWLKLERDPQTNNWGELDKKDRADY